MSICNCPIVDPEKQKTLVLDFLKSVQSNPKWNLLSLIDMYNSGNSMSSIEEVIPFRGGACNRSMRCCGMCTRICYTRCIQDCLHRLYMWRELVESTPSTEREKLPLNLRMIVSQKFETLEDLSWVVGEILSKHKNTELREYMKNAKIGNNNNPYKLDYSPKVDIDPITGRRRVDPITGELHILAWPTTGLCPYCLPNVTVDRRVYKRRLKRE